MLEKDVWVCWALNEVFSMAGALPMVFKGGTSLSKVFGAIRRFSEDVDLTVDHASLANEFDPFAPGVSKTQLRKLRETLSKELARHLESRVLPHLEERASRFTGQGCSVEYDGKETIEFYYPSALEDLDGYFREPVKLEFGGRNTIRPGALHTVKADLAEHLGQLSFPEAKVQVLDASRTFWEKATLAHSECNRPSARPEGVNRLSRHWYDLYVLADGPIGESALLNRRLLEEVVKLKSLFFHSPWARYENCLEGGLRLVPEAPLLHALAKDYAAMINAQMFYATPPRFEELVARLRSVEDGINAP